MRRAKIPDDLTNALAFTDEGRDLRDALHVKQDVPVKEAKLLCLLTLAYERPLIDPLASDIAMLEHSIHSQMMKRAIYFPFIYGRELYDRAAEVFGIEKPVFNHDETLTLLEDTSVGVFQAGQYVTGPYGLLSSGISRNFAPTRRIPLYHCHELTCSKLHRATLTTDMSAPIYEHAMKVYQYFDKRNEERSAWGKFIGEVTGASAARYDDTAADSLIFALGDCLDNVELREVFAYAMDNSNGNFRASVEPLGIKGAAEGAARELSCAQLLQTLLLHSDSELVRAIDALVVDGRIHVPRGEVRRPLMTSGYSTGTFGLVAEVGQYGVRFVSSSSDIAPLRLRRLVLTLYPLSESGNSGELDWQLRGVDGESLQARMESAIRSWPPGEVVSRLVLSQRANVIQTCSKLGITDNWMSDQELVEAVLWKLGFDAPIEFDVNDGFWTSYERIRSMVSTVAVSAVVDVERMREVAVNFFVRLEGLLDDSLAFATWALTGDHLQEAHPFSYSLSHRLGALHRLNSAQTTESVGAEDSHVVHFDDENTLYSLSRGYNILAEYLLDRRNQEVLYRRDDKQMPEYATHTTLKSFPFTHTVAFLDLLPSSQDMILKGLAQVSAYLARSKVAKFRNEQLHFRRASPDLLELQKCLDDVGEAARLLEELGFTRVAFIPVRSTADEFARTIHVLANSHGREIAFSRPSIHNWVQFPGLRRPQYLMTSAKFAEPNEMLRFRLRPKSRYSQFWVDYPKRMAESMNQANAAGEGPYLMEEGDYGPGVS